MQQMQERVGFVEDMVPAEARMESAEARLDSRVDVLKIMDSRGVRGG